VTGAPPFFEASFLDEVRRRTPLKALVASRVKLQRSGKQWKGLCPLHKEKTPSFTVFADNRFRCFGCGAHGDVFDYVMKTQGGAFHETVLHLASQAGIPIPEGHQHNGRQHHRGDYERQPGSKKPNGNGADHSELWQPIMPPPADAPKPTDKDLRCDDLHEYPDPNDKLLCFIRRFEARGGASKFFLPLTFGILNGKRGWHAKAPDEPRPLYGLNRLSHAAPDATVLLCEGEKSADAALRLFPGMVCMTWMGGCKADHLADFSPLDGRDVILWPDADKGGRDVMERISGRLPLSRIINTADLSDGYDAANLERDDCDDPDAWLKARLPHEPPKVGWRDVRLSSWAGRELPQRRWIVPEWIPTEQVTALYGVGGINKTDFLIQLSMCFSRGLPFLGYPLEPAPAYGLFCEDTEGEIVRRAARIARHYGLGLGDFPDFHFASLVGFVETEFVTFDGSKMVTGSALERFDQAILKHRAGLCVLDTVPDFFGGNEIARREVSQFIRVLDAISMQRGCGLVFTAHPSVRGQESGALDSGSTGWTGKVRARMSLHDPGPDNEDEDEAKERRRLRQPAPSTDWRILIRQKSNYAAQGAVLKLICRDGVFTTEALDAKAAQGRGPARDAAAEAKFLDLLGKIEAQGDYVNNVNNGIRYAPRHFARRPDGRGFSEAEYTRAMQRLFVAGRLRMAPFGLPSRGKSKLVEIQP
jgi:RecA-family ATPase